MEEEIKYERKELPVHILRNLPVWLSGKRIMERKAEWRQNRIIPAALSPIAFSPQFKRVGRAALFCLLQKRTVTNDELSTDLNFGIAVFTVKYGIV